MASHFFQRPLRLTSSVLKLCCLTHLTFTEFIQVAPSQGPSMVPTFTVQGDWILSDMTCRRGRGVGVGDVVMYRIPISDINCGVKRIIGMPGDYVTLRNPYDLSGSQVIQVRHAWA
jgi:mitochondrial inner membrane protease subunit 1